MPRTGSTAASHEVFICPRCAADRRPEHFGSDRNCAFNADGSFTPDNWNCATLAALMERGCIDERRSDESIQIIMGEDYGGFLVLSRYKNRGCTSSAVLVGDFWPAQPLTFDIAQSWLDGSFWEESKSPALLDAVDPADGLVAPGLRAPRETVRYEGVPSPAVEQGRLQALIEKLPRYQLHVSLERMEPFVRPFDSDPNDTGAFVRLEELEAVLRAALSVEAPASNVSTNLSAIENGQFARSKHD